MNGYKKHTVTRYVLTKAETNRSANKRITDLDDLLSNEYISEESFLKRQVLARRLERLVEKLDSGIHDL